MPLAPTGFARLTPRAAGAALLAFVAVSLAAVAVSLSPVRINRAALAAPRNSDLCLYQAEVERIRRGEGYYQAAAAELAARGYPTASVFNWRLPLPMWLLGKLPDARWGQALLGLAALGVLVWGFALLADEGRTWEGVLGAVLLTGALLPVVLDGLYVLPVLWAGVLGALALLAAARGRPALGILSGTAALLTRELALPLAVAAGWFAWRDGRRREALGWLLGLVLFGAYLGLHIAHVREHYISPESRAQAESWIQFNAAPMVLAVCQMNVYLLLLPQWVTALVVPLALVGFAGWHTPAGQTIGTVVCLFLVAFAIVGQPFNQYWGCLFAPLLCLGAARGPRSLADLWRAARWKIPSWATAG